MLHKPIRLPFVEIIQLSEQGSGGVPRWIQVAKVGEFKKDPNTGKPFAITSTMLAEMVKNFGARVRGIDLAVDYFHENDKLAAGWFKKLETRAEGQQLWAEVDWTKSAEQKLAEKELRYFSPEFAQSYSDPETGMKHGAVLLGGGLTNRPFLKNMTPVVELTEAERKNMKTVEELQTEVTQLAEKNTALETEVKTLKEGPDSAAKLKEKIKSMEEELAGAKKQLAEMDSEKKLAEKKGAFDKMLSEGKAVEAQREAYMSGDVAKFAELAGTAPNLKATGTGANPPATPSNADEAADQITKLAEEKVSKKEASNFEAAVTLVLKEKPDLKKAAGY